MLVFTEIKGHEVQNRAAEVAKALSQRTDELAVPLACAITPQS